MMERFFIVKEGTELHKSYIEWQENIKKVNEFVKGFFKKHNIEPVRYIACDSLFIDATKLDEEKFKEQFKQQNHTNLKQFKKNSTIGKEWSKALKDSKLKIIHKPRLLYYIPNRIGGRFLERLFMQNGVMYGSYESEGNFNLPSDIFEELKGSEFYKVLESEG